MATGTTSTLKSDLISIFRALSREEINQLRYFFRSRYFSNNKNASLFFDELCEYYPLFEIHESDKLKMFRNIYGDIPYNDSTFRSLLHCLRQPVDDFLSAQYYKRNSIEKELAVIEELKYRNIEDLLLKKIGKLKLSLPDDVNVFSFHSLQNKIKIDNQILNYSILNERVLHKDTIDNQFKSIVRSFDYEALEYFIESVNKYVLFEVFRKTCELSEISGSKLNIRYFNIKSLKNNFMDCPAVISVIDLYEMLYKMFHEFRKENNYSEYKNKFNECRDFLDKEELKNHFLNIVSYLIIKKNNSAVNEIYKLELWNTYREMQELDLLIESSNPYLDINLYRSILFLGLSLKLYDETREFIDKYSKKVNPAEYKNILHLSYGNLYYETGEYKKALKSALKIIISDFVFKYDTKNLLIKIYYDLGFWDNLTSTIISYKEFLRNDPVLISKLKNKFKLYIHYLELLINCESNKDKTDVQYYLIKLNSEDVYNKEWLINKYSEYINKHTGSKYA